MRFFVGILLLKTDIFRSLQEVSEVDFLNRCRKSAVGVSVSEVKNKVSLPALHECIENTLVNTQNVFKNKVFKYCPALLMGHPV